METTPDNTAGSERAPMPSPTATSPAESHAADTSGGGTHHHRQSWLYRRILKSGVIEPVRKVLKPLLLWTFKPHITVHGEGEQETRVDVNLKPPSTVVIVWWTIFGPLIFLMLLPLILILIPVIMVIGLAGIVVAAMQTDSDESQHQSLTTHVMR